MEPIPLVLEEEIALEGLDGITLETLWFRLSERLKYPLPFGESFKNTLFKIILKENDFEYYEIEKPRLTPTRLDRLQYFSEETNDNVERVISETYSIYSYHPVDDPFIRGSCQEFKTRKQINIEFMRKNSLTEIERTYGRKLVIVASQRMRNNVLIPTNIGRDCDINNHTYCFLERIGRSRYFGEATSGPNSANDLLKDSKLLHYFRNQLLKNNLVMRQQIQSKVRGKNVQIQLFHLPRFFVMVQVSHMVMTEKLFNYLLEKKPTYAAQTEDVRSFLGLAQKSFRLFMKTKDHIFECGMMKKENVIPTVQDKEKKVKEKLMHAVKLRDPDFDLFSLYTDEKEEHGEESGFLDQSNQTMNSSLAWQVIEKIEQSEGVGMSQAEIGKYFGLSRLNARGIIRKITKNNEITSYLKDEGRQRTSRYVHKKYKNDKTKKIVDQVAKLVKKAEEITSAQPVIQFVEEAPQTAAPPENDSLKVSIPLKLIHPEPDQTEIINIIKRIDTEDLSSNDNSMNPQYFEDAYTIEVEEPCAIGNLENVDVTMKFLNTLPGVKPCTSLATAIAQNKVSEKVLNRMNLVLDILKEKTIIDALQLLNLMRQQEEHCKEIICRKSMLTICNQLAADNFLKAIEMELKSPTRTVKTLYLGEPHVTLDTRFWHSIIEEQKLQQFLKPIPEGKEEPKVEPTVSGISFISKESEAVLEFSAQSIKLHNHFPKFQKYKLFHEFLFYLIYDYPKEPKKTPIKEAIAIWKKENQNISNLDEIASNISTAYSTDSNWKMFVPPLNPYRGYESGWGLLRDIIHRVPLILYVKFTRYGNYVPDITEYLEHPIKRNYLIHFLPSNVKTALLQGRKHVQVFFDLCKRMCILGLLQIGPNRSKEIDYHYMYLNRNASVLDTTISSGKYAQVDDLEYAQHRYFFDSPQIVDDYWIDLMKTCINTPISRINAPDYNPIAHDRVVIKPELQKYLLVQTAEKAPQNDLGEIPGDRKGAAGLDSWLVSHARANWSKEPAPPRKRKRKLPRLPVKSSKRTRKMVKDEKKEKGVIFSKTITVRKRIRKKSILPKKRIPTKAETLTGIHRGALSSIIRKPISTKKINKRNYDDVDRMALQFVPRSGRCMWSDIEDETLVLIKSALKFLFKSEAQCAYFFSSVVIRDILSWRTPKALDKTTEACKRRIIYLLKKPEMKEKLSMYIDELSVTREFKRKLETFTEMITKQKKAKDIQKRVKIFIVEFVHRMHQFFLRQFMTTSIKNERVLELPSVFKNLDNFCITICTSDSSSEFKYKEPMNPLQAEIASISSLIHSGLSCLRDKTSNEYYLYEIYKKYSDNHLSEATNMLRRIQVISTKSNTKTRYHLSNRYALQLASLHIPFELYDEYLDGMKILSQYVQAQQMKTVNCGVIFMLAEMLIDNKIELTLEKAEKLIMVDPSLKKKTHFAEISDNYLAALKEDEKRKAKEKKKQLQFPNDETSDIKFYHTEDPVEIFYKFNDFYLHIFCLLIAIKNDEAVKADRWCIEEDKCSLKNCILNLENEIDLGPNVIENANQVFYTINAILNMDPSEQEIESNVTKENLMKFFDHKIAEFETQNVENYRKDVSKKLSSDIHQKINTKFLLKRIHDLAAEKDQEDGAWLTEYKKISVETAEEIFDEDEEIDPIKHSSISHQLKDLNVPNRSSDSFVVNLSTIYIDIVGEKYQEITIDDEKFDSRLISFDQELRTQLVEKLKLVHVWMPEELIENSIESELSIIAGNLSLLMDICEFIKEKGEMGATASEMIEKFANKKELQKNVESLMIHKIIVRAGINQIRFIHRSCATKWLLLALYLTEDKDVESATQEPPLKKQKVDETVGESSTAEESTDKQVTKGEIVKKYIQHSYYVLPAPWIRVGPLNRTINSRCLDKWLGTILNYLSINPGILLTDLRNKFNILNPVHLYNLCEILAEIGCLKIMAHTEHEVDIFSEYCGESEEPATYFDAFDHTFVEVSTDAFQRLSIFIGKHYYKTPFI